MSELNNNSILNNSNSANNTGVSTNSSATSNSSNATSNGSLSSSANNATDTKATSDDAPKGKTKQDWSGKAEDTQHQRVLNITETDGTQVKLTMQFTSIPDAENIQDQSVAMYTDAYGHPYRRQTISAYHKALMRIFKPAIVNGFAAGRVNFDFFSKHEQKTYEYAMRQADSFLASPTNAFKA